MSFSDDYTALRQREGRVYPDAVLRKLPDIDSNHPLAREWRQRKASLVRLMGYLRGLDQPLRILDLGCGIGWMSHHLSRLPDSEIIGVERIASEMDQAREIFSDRDNLLFREADVFHDELGQFDVIVMGASVQYFPALTALVERLTDLLNPGGEIHILDTPFYKRDQVEKAKMRSQTYYRKMGYGELAGHYHHHAREEMEELGGESLYDPGTLWHRMTRRLLGQVDSPFPWYRIRPATHW